MEISGKYKGFEANTVLLLLFLPPKAFFHSFFLNRYSISFGASPKTVKVNLYIK